MAAKPLLVLLHPHFTLPGGAGKYALEVLRLYTPQYRVVVIGQQVADWWTQQYPEIEFVNLHGPLTSSLWYWLFWPVWYVKTARHLKQFEHEYGTFTLINSVFPAHWVGLLYKRIHASIHTIWFCQEPSAFIYFRTWQNAIINPAKRLAAKVLAPVLRVIDQWLAKGCDVLIVNSNASQRSVEQVYHRTGVVVYGGVQKKDIPIVPVAQRPKQIMTVARLTSFKRIDVLVQAFIQAQLTDYTLHIYGDGEEREHLQAMIVQAGEVDRIVIHAQANDQELVQAYAAARLFVLCSRNEPFGIVAVEAMAYGTPVIADASGGPAEIVLPGQTGQLIDLEVQSLTETLRMLTADIAKLQTWSEAAQMRAAQVFTWQTAANTIQQYL